MRENQETNITLKDNNQAAFLDQIKIHITHMEIIWEDKLMMILIDLEQLETIEVEIMEIKILLVHSLEADFQDFSEIIIINDFNFSIYIYYFSSFLTFDKSLKSNKILVNSKFSLKKN